MLVLCCTYWFKVEEEEETFVILMAQYNISYSCGDTLMKLIKGSFHRQKPCQDHKQMSDKIQCLKQRNASFSMLLCYWFVFFTPVIFFYSFHAIAKPSLSLVCPELFLMSTISHGKEYGQFGSAILAGSSVSLLPLPLLGQRKKRKLWFPRWEMKPTGFSPTPIQKASSWRCKRLARSTTCPVNPTWQKGCSTQSGVFS